MSSRYDDYKNITPDDVLSFSKPTNSFLCPLSANTYGIEFLAFSISDCDTKKVIFDVARDSPPPAEMMMDVDLSDENSYRRIRYDFSEDVLRLPRISTMLVFSVGPREVRGFRMVERHYFKDQLIKSFDFTFGFCIPGSTNTWTAVYSLPPLSDELVDDIVAHPYATSSDSFYFVEDRLIMHNKASYRYIAEDRAQSKRSYDRYQAPSKGLSPRAAAASKAAAPKADGTEDDDDDDRPGFKQGGGGAKASAKWEDEENWSKESDYF